MPRRILRTLSLLSVGVVTVLIAAAGLVVAMSLEPQLRFPGAEVQQGCGAAAEEAILESQDFTPYAERLTHLASAGRPILPEGAAALVGVPANAAIQVQGINGLARRHTVTGDGVAYAYFLGKPMAGLTRSEFLSAGGVQLDQDPRTGTQAFADYLVGRLGERAVAVAVGPYDGALTWSDPDEQGIRPHNVYWSDGSFEFALTANLSAADLLDTARSLVCG